ncbi:tRNA pseudouridine(55) synthase TruB [Wielerella bovis]|uniref:tRNA pseudouridine(55) synthase TruB n=1 Tax=Wielerella bovis TaxID=2917790 RepID=UPI002018EFAC|nr:tRNA pseudouridine(55) synthase TruB [Wielerella bovis]ULJ59355.1 tRNA pseudouridine(55) synthase TruB [Wielerella bovis]
MNEKTKKRALNGVLLLDKPLGISSNTALQQARRLFRAEKAGHTGVLDPLASGLLPVCFGEATKFAQYLLDADKAYTATLKLGEATTTGDAEGEIIDTARADISRDEFQAACAALTGEIRQVPPMFSALKHEGKPLYEYARKGIVIERKAREITIYDIEIKEFSSHKAVINVRCSKGTYIRTLSEDIAKHIGTFAHLTALRRTETAGFRIEQTHTLDALAALSESERDGVLLPCDVLVQHLPRVDLDDETARKLRFGQAATFHDVSGSLKSNAPIRAYDLAGEFVGLVEYFSHHHCLKALRLMNTSRKMVSDCQKNTSSC